MRPKIKDGKVIRYEEDLMSDLVRWSKTWGAKSYTEEQATREAKEWKDGITAALALRRDILAANKRGMDAADRLGVPASFAQEVLPPLSGGNGEDLLKWFEARSRPVPFESVGEKKKTVGDAWNQYMAHRLKEAGYNEQASKEEKEAFKKACYLTGAQRWTYEMVFSCLKTLEKMPDYSDRKGWTAIFDDARNKIKNLTHKKTGKPLAISSRNAYLSILVSFVCWLDSSDTMELLPKNMDSLVESFGIAEDDAVEIRPEHLKEIWDFARDDFRCYMLLALNFGFYQKDIQLLTADMVDFENMRVFGERNKTHVGYNMKMWDETAYWLKKRIAKEGHLMHGGKSGYLLSSKRGGKMMAIKAMFYDLQKQLWGNYKYSFSNFRDTSATVMLHDIPGGADSTSAFLRHAVRGMKKRYALGRGRTKETKEKVRTGVSETLDKATDQLREKFTWIDKSETRPYSSKNILKVNKQRWESSKKGPIS